MAPRMAQINITENKLLFCHILTILCNILSLKMTKIMKIYKCCNENYIASLKTKILFLPELTITVLS